MFDMEEEFESLIEQVMRYEFNLDPYQGIANLNIWKDRKNKFFSIVNKALSIANKGLIFTTYADMSELITQGEVVNRKEVPRWSVYLAMVTDVVLHTFIDDRTGEFKVKVVSSKFDDYIPTGQVFNVHNKRFYDLLPKKP